ncbi:MAG TPA: amidohydrolase [Chryseosolibacter sp.]|nr:amidohydrolase [Chryseosolibacter sp.]
MRTVLSLVLLVCSVMNCSAQASRQNNRQMLKDAAIKNIDREYERLQEIALDIWRFAEVGYKEKQSAALLSATLKENGFSVESDVAGMPTAFVATFGTGKPVIGLLAEYDALPGLSQEAIPERKPVPGQSAGHGCGHHLFGTASVAAAIELKKLIEAKKLSGTIKVFGTPAEEGGSGKVYMVRAGLFDNLDAVLHWHPGDRNEVTMSSALANKSAKFRFYGVAAHAAMAPDQGRSALDAVEAMNYMTNMMREHMPSDMRLHYIITEGGKAPNVIPDFAEVYYYVRHPKRDQTAAAFERIVNAAKGAALGTETRMDYEIIGGTHDMLINKTLASVMYENLKRIGGVAYDQKDIEFATQIQSTLQNSGALVESAGSIMPLRTEVSVWPASTDVGDVSYVAPTVGLYAATWVPGTPAHSWQAVACGATPIGMKGMIVAAKTMALTGIDLLSDPAVIKKAKDELMESVGDYQYQPLLGDRKPALNYRD